MFRVKRQNGYKKSWLILEREHRSASLGIEQYPDHFAFFCGVGVRYYRNQQFPIVFSNNQQNMKMQPSSKYESSTLPTIPDNSFSHPEQKSFSKSPPHPLLLKLAHLENTLIKVNRQHTALLHDQDRLRGILQQKLKLVGGVLKERENGQRESIQYEGEIQNRLQLKENCIPFQTPSHYKDSHFKPDATRRKYFYSTLNSPRELSEESCTLSSSRTDSAVDQDLNKASGFTLKKYPVPQNSLQTSSIRRQTVQTYLNSSKYKNIEQIWNEAGKRQSRLLDCELRKTYL